MRLTALCALVTTALLGAVAPAPAAAETITYTLDVALTDQDDPGTVAVESTDSLTRVVVIGLKGNAVVGHSTAAFANFTLGSQAQTFTLDVSSPANAPDEFLVLGLRVPEAGGASSVAVSFFGGFDDHGLTQNFSTWDSAFPGGHFYGEEDIEDDLQSGGLANLDSFAAHYATRGKNGMAGAGGVGYDGLVLGVAGDLISFTVAQPYGSVTIRTSEEVPEPTTVALLGVGAVALAARPRRTAR